MTYPEKGVLTTAAQVYKPECILHFTKCIEVGKKVVRGKFAHDSKNMSITFQHHPDE